MSADVIAGRNGDTFLFTVDGIQFTMERRHALRLAAAMLTHFEVVTLMFPLTTGEVSRFLKAIRSDTLEEFLNPGVEHLDPKTAVIRG